MLEPNVVLLYVDDPAITSQFYQNLLGMKPEEASITFDSFTLSNGMNLVAFGYTFVALYLDSHRLRVAALGKL